MEEREIALKDLIVDILSQWRGITIAMVLGGILLGSFGYVRAVQSAKIEQNIVEVSDEEQIVQIEESLTESEKAGVLIAIANENECLLREHYRNSVIVMQMDPFNVSRIELVYTVQAEDMEQSCMISSAYELLLNGVGLYEWVEKETGIATTDAKGLIASDEQLEKEGVDEGTILKFQDNSIKIVISHVNDEECAKLASAVKSYVEAQQKQLASKMGTHKLILLSESAAVTVDTDIFAKQVANLKSRASLLESYSKKKDAFTDNQQKYYDLLTMEQSGENTEEDTVAENPTVQPASSFSVKYVLLGAALFAFAYVCIIFVMYIMNGKLRATDELQLLYNIPQMGLVVKDSKKQFFIDNWIRALRNHGKRQFTADQSLDLAITAVKISAAKNEMTDVCLMGCDMKAGAEVVCKKLKTALEKEKLAVTILDNVLYDAEAMEKLENVKGVVLVEKAGSTMYREIADELELAKRQGIKVLGGIIVE